MIQLTKLDNTPILLCLENIKYVENTPDTIILFTSGDTLIVKESIDDFKNKALAFYQKVNARQKVEPENDAVESE